MRNDGGEHSWDGGRGAREMWERYQGRLIRHQVDLPHGSSAPLPAHVPAQCTAHTNDGRLVTVEGVVTHRSRNPDGTDGQWLTFQEDIDGWGPAAAWVHIDCCEPLGPPPRAHPRG